MPKNLRMRLRLREVPGRIYPAAEGVSMKAFCGETKPETDEDVEKQEQSDKELLKKWAQYLDLDDIDGTFSELICEHEDEFLDLLQQKRKSERQKRDLGRQEERQLLMKTNEYQISIRAAEQRGYKRCQDDLLKKDFDIVSKLEFERLQELDAASDPCTRFTSGMGRDIGHIIVRKMQDAERRVVGEIKKDLLELLNEKGQSAEQIIAIDACLFRVQKYGVPDMQPTVASPSNPKDCRTPKVEK
jgi:hypothetical protein